MIEYVSGDFFDYNADIRINTVNCVGVMGAGVALEFKNKYPDMFKAYVKVCNEKKIEPGNPYIWEEQDLFSKCVIINLPTKIHWKNPSKYEYVKKDLEWLRQYLKCKDKNCVVTLPALGCGHGGLNWSIIRNEIEYYLGDMQAKILVFEPSSSNMKLSNFNYEIRKQDDIKIIRREDEKYLYVADIDNELYCRGNIDLLELKKLSIICGNSILNREKNATLSILEEMKTDNCAIVFNLCSIFIDICQLKSLQIM
jgi:O-acetyl-ADP-ribose deacetylase (regulator of RNase III)